MEQPQDQAHGLLGEDSRDLDASHSPRGHAQVAPPSPRRLALDAQTRSTTSTSGHTVTPPSRQPSPAIATSETSGSAQQQQQPPFGGRLPSTPPLSRQKLLMRPYRRTADGHHTHLHPFGSGSTSSGVRSAFKDFVVPAQIILLCSILNATWPLLTSTVTTVVEFLALVFASYIACARRSQDCYFLEPLSHSSHDREGTIYVATIHWTLRALLFFGVGFVIMFAGTRIAKFLRPVFAKEEHLRAEYVLGLDSLTSSASTPPTSRSHRFGWLPFIRRLSRPKPDSPRPTRSRTSSSSSPWLPSRANPPTPSSLEAAQPLRHGKSLSSASLDSSSKPHKARSKGGKKSTQQPSVDNGHIAGSHAGSHAQPLKKQDSSSNLAPLSSNKDMFRTEHSHGDLEDKDDADTLNGSNSENCPHDHSASLDQAMHTIHPESVDEPTHAASNEPAAPVQLDCTQAVRSGPEPSASDTMEPSASLSSTTKDTTQSTEVNSDFISPHEKRRRRKAKGQKAQRAITATESESSVKSTREKQSKSTGVSPDVPRQETESKQTKPAALHSNTATPPTTRHDIAKAGSKDRVTFSADTPPSPGFPTSVHPLHALNSNSTIVRTKTLHKRSQSAQLPSTMPWNNHSSVEKGTPATRADSPLPQVTLREPPLQDNPKLSGDTLTFRRASAQTGPDAIRTISTDTNVHRWYSPFQSGLDISIDGEGGEKPVSENPGVQPESCPEPSSTPQRPASGSKPATTKLKLPPFLATPSSFFESSPRTPRIMPFSQNQQQHPHPYGALAGMSLEDSWTRARSSSIGAPLTPQLDTIDPFDFGSGSKSAGCSRRNSIESNLMESLLSGKTRMFGDLENDVPYSGTTAPIQLTSPLVSSTPSAASPLVALDFLSTMGAPLTPLQVETLPDAAPAPPSLGSHDSDVPVFVNPWDTEDQYAPTSTTPAPYLPSILLASTRYSSAPMDPAATARQASLLRAMNSGSLSGTLVNSPSVHPTVMANESDPLTLVPNLGSSRPSSSLLPSIPKFGPYPSVEMSLAAEVNKPPPLREIPLDDSFEKLSMEDVIRKKAGQERKKTHRRTSSSSNNSNSHQHGSGHGSEQEDSKKPVNRNHLQRTSRTGSSRSGHNKSASLGSFLPPLPPPSSDKNDGALPATASTTGDKKSLSTSKSSGRDVHSQNRDEIGSKGGDLPVTRRTKQTSTASSGRDVASSKSLNKARV